MWACARGEASKEITEYLERWFAVQALLRERTPWVVTGRLGHGVAVKAAGAGESAIDPRASAKAIAYFLYASGNSKARVSSDE
jgi:hypothetical protein